MLGTAVWNREGRAMVVNTWKARSLIHKACCCSILLGLPAPGRELYVPRMLFFIKLQYNVARGSTSAGWPRCFPATGLVQKKVY